MEIGQRQPHWVAAGYDIHWELGWPKFQFQRLCESLHASRIVASFILTAQESRSQNTQLKNLFLRFSKSCVCPRYPNNVIEGRPLMLKWREREREREPNGTESEVLLSLLPSPFGIVAVPLWKRLLSVAAKIEWLRKYFDGYASRRLVEYYSPLIRFLVHYLWHHWEFVKVSLKAIGCLLWHCIQSVLL